MVTIFHLSDIHFSENRENVFAKKHRLFYKSIIAEARSASHIIICVSGDIANFGSANEYLEYALPFFDGLKEALESEIEDLICDFLFVPGNHDCDFSDKAKVELRDDFIGILAKQPNKADNPEYVEHIIFQHPFNEFKETFYEMYPWKACTLIKENILISRVKMEVGGKTINFNLFNTSWISTRNEQPGRMIFPIDFMKILPPSVGDVNLSIIHHPTHWLEPNNKREFESHIQVSSDFILSGHEHVPSKTTFTDWGRRQVHFIEGCALQEHDSPEISGYNVINIDLEENKFQVKNVSWNSKYYQGEDDNEDWLSLSKDLSVIANDSKSLTPNLKFGEFLTNIELPVSHPRKEDLKLKDVYTFPNIKEVIYQEDSQTLTKPEDVPELLHNEKEAHLLFTGDKDSGKTALAKMLFTYFYEEKYYPLYIDGEDLTPSTARNINLLLKNNYSNVYKEGSRDLYLQLSKKERVLLIDNWHHSKVNSQAKSNFLFEADKYFQQVIFLSEVNDTVTNAIDMSSKESAYQFRHFELMEFGHVKQDEFIENWVRLGQGDTLETKYLMKEIDRKRYELRPVLMESFVPKFPLYILIILNTIESGTPHNLDKSSNGYYFEILIKDSLASIEIENNETDKIYQYLTDFSYELLIKQTNSVTLQEWREFHRNHLDYYDMNEDQIIFNKLQGKFEKEKVIRNNDSTYEFYYPYVYYFFIAQYFARNIHEREVKERIRNLCENLHITENANIIMFLTHLSKSDFIKDEVINAAKGIFGEIQPLKLEDDVKIINDLCDELSPLVLEDVNVREHRKEINQQLDEIDLKHRQESIENEQQIASGLEFEESDEVAETMNQINMTNKGFKMLDIMGQILRNYYGSMSGANKKELCEEHFKLGLRISYNYINQLSNQNENIVGFISSAVVEKELESHERAEKLARRIVYSFGGFIAYNTIGKIGTSIGTPDLDRTFIRVQESLPFNSVELINLFIKIEYYDQFPYNELAKFHKDNKYNKIAVEMARMMVKRYLYMFETSHSEKQKICDLVGIQMSAKLRMQLKGKTKRR